MHFKYDVDVLNKISNVKDSKDIKSISNALFPGAHCPLFGAAMISSQVDDLEVIVVGTDECTYYTQAFVIDRLSKNNNYWSYSMQQNDVVFGSFDKVCEAVEYVYNIKKPKAIMIISTCIPEIIGDDFESVALKMEPVLKIPILVVKTEHFTCNNHISGIETTLTSFVKLMKPYEKLDNRINILGHRFGKLEASELYKLLISRGYDFALTLPSKTNIDSIEKASSARINLVVDFTAIPLAKKMEENFNIPYVVFNKDLNPKRIKESYDLLQGVLNIDLSDDLNKISINLEQTITKAKDTLNGKTFIYGNSPMGAFEVSSFLSQLGMKPLIIQARDIYDGDHIYFKEILEKGFDPYVSNIANVSAMQHLYPVLKPNVYIGHENPMNLMRNNINQVVLDMSASNLGYELPMCVLNMVMEAVKGKVMDKKMAHMRGGN